MAPSRTTPYVNPTPLRPGPHPDPTTKAPSRARWGPPTSTPGAFQRAPSKASTQAQSPQSVDGPVRSTALARPLPAPACERVATSPRYPQQKMVHAKRGSAMVSLCRHRFNPLQASQIVVGMVSKCRPETSQTVVLAGQHDAVNDRFRSQVAEWRLKWFDPTGAGPSGLDPENSTCRTPPAEHRRIAKCRIKRRRAKEWWYMQSPALPRPCHGEVGAPVRRSPKADGRRDTPPGTQAPPPSV
jgi:hypothetical protein